MSKSTFFTGQPIFTQILRFIPKGKIHQLGQAHNADHYCKKFTTHAHLITLLYAVLNRCTSLREVTTGLLALEQKLAHLGLSHTPRRSTISDANTKRDAGVFEAIYHMLYENLKHFLPDSQTPKRRNKTYIIDSTSIALFQEVLNGTGIRSHHGKRKGGIKVHTLMRSDEDVPQLIRFGARANSDSPFLKEIKLPPGSILIFDRGYNKYTEWNRLTKEKISWVTRLRKDTTYQVIKKHTLSDLQKEKGVISDVLVDVGNTVDKNAVHVNARLITYRDKTTKAIFQFLTNNTTYAPGTVADLYKQRWQIELLFKRIKQNYPLSSFLGDSENAIKIQIWVTLIADLILKVIKQTGAKKWAFSNLIGMVRLHLMTYINMFAFLKNPEKALRSVHKKVFLPQLFPT